MSECRHEYIVKDGASQNHALKITLCRFCNDIKEVVGKGEKVTPSPIIKYGGLLSECYDYFMGRYPLMKEENREAMAVSLFIQVSKYT